MTDQPKQQPTTERIPADVRFEIMRKLKRGRPDLVEKIAAGELTLRDAAIQAGFKDFVK